MNNGKIIKAILVVGSGLAFGIQQLLEWAKEKQEEERFNERFDERFDSRMSERNEIQEANFDEIEEETEETT